MSKVVYLPTARASQRYQKDLGYVVELLDNVADALLDASIELAVAGEEVTPSKGRGKKARPKQVGSSLSKEEAILVNSKDANVTELLRLAMQIQLTARSISQKSV